MNEILNKIYAVLLYQEVSIESKFILYDKMNIEWNCNIEKYKKIHKFIGESLSKSENPNIILCTVYMKRNNLFNSTFKVTHVSEFNSIFSWGDVTRFDSYINEIEHGYVLSQMNLIIRDLSTSISSDNPTIDNVRKVLTRGIELTDTKGIIIDSNSLILDRVITKHENVKSGNSVGVELGFFSLREKVVLEDVDMMVIGARPSMGKTAYAVSMLVKLVFQQNEKVLFFALEMSKEQMMRRIISNITGISGWKIKYGKLSDSEIEIIGNIKQLDQWNNFEIIEGTQTANDIYFATSKRKNLGVVTIVIIDYLQKIKGEGKQSRYEAVTNASNRIKELSQNLKIPSICLAQLGRGVEQRGGDKKPVLSDLRDSGEIEQDASIIAFLHRSEYYGMYEDENGESTRNKGEFIVAKNRDGEIGSFIFNICPDTIKWSDSEVFEIKPEQQSNLIEQQGFGFETTNETPF